jgi:hypothetical protein
VAILAFLRPESVCFCFIHTFPLRLFFPWIEFRRTNNQYGCWFRTN